MTKSHQIFLKVLLLASSFTILDQATKWIARTNLVDTHIKIIPNFAALVYAENTGVAWSLPVSQWVLLLGVPTIIALGIYFLPRHFNFKKKITQYIFAALLAGAISNYFDRLFFGYVIDFISIWRWPVFNLADIYITCAVFFIVVFYGKIERNL